MRIFLISAFLILISTSCKPQPEAKSNPPGYDLQQPEKFSLTESLLEISGVAFKNGESDTIFAVQDEDGRLFRVAWGNKDQTNISFAGAGDYEDLAIIKDKVFILKSNGNLYSFMLNQASGKKVTQVNEHEKLLPPGEYEGMYYDPLSDRLTVLCKSCKVDKKKKSVTGYLLQAKGDQLLLSGTFKLKGLKDNKAIKGTLKPSAIARHPLTSKWYVLSSVNKALLILNDEWQIEKVHPLSSKIFNQPEGIAFDKNANLYISNEGDELTLGNILKFVYKP